MIFVLFITGLAAGIIDAIAGGGGLITLPVWSLYLGPGAHAIGTNKIVGTLASLTALIVYLKHGKISWKKGGVFLASIAIGSFIGSETSFASFFYLFNALHLSRNSLACMEKGEILWSTSDEKENPFWELCFKRFTVWVL